jgi:hypothetical protein
MDTSWALLKLVGAEELSRQVNQWLTEHAARLAS